MAPFAKKRNGQRRKLHLSAKALYVLKRVALCLAILAVLCVLPVFVNNLFGYAPVVAYVALIALDFVYLQILRRSVEFEELSSREDCQRGQSIDFIVRLTNKSILPFPQIDVAFYVSDLFGGQDTLHTSVVTLAPKEVRDFVFDIRFDHIGRFTAGLQSMTITDPLGLFRHTVSGTRACHIAVTPKVFPVNALETVTEETPDSIERVLSATENSMDYASVRDYVMGDPLKAIHWKLSARCENYLTRLYESYSNPRLDVVLDFCAPAALTAEEMMNVYDVLLETAFSLLNWSAENSMACNLVYQSQSGQTRTISSHLDAWSMLEACSDMPRISAEPSLGIASEELLQHVARSQTSSNIAYVSSRIQSDVINGLMSAKKGKKRLMFFGLLPSQLQGEERAEYVRPLRALESFSIAGYALASAEELGGGDLQ